LGTKDSFWFQFSHIATPTTSLNPIGQQTSTPTWIAHTIGVNWTHSFGPTSVLQAQFGRTYAILNTLNSRPNGVESLDVQYRRRLHLRLSRRQVLSTSRRLDERFLSMELAENMRLADFSVLWKGGSARGRPFEEKMQLAGSKTGGWVYDEPWWGGHNGNPAQKDMDNCSG
jgi:hypothetical protein